MGGGGQKKIQLWGEAGGELANIIYYWESRHTKFDCEEEYEDEKI